MLGTWALSGLVTSVFEFWEILNYFNDEGFFSHFLFSPSVLLLFVY